MEHIPVPSLNFDLKGSKMQVFHKEQASLPSSMDNILLKEVVLKGGTAVGNTKPIWPSVISNFTWKPPEWISGASVTYKNIDKIKMVFITPDNSKCHTSYKNKYQQRISNEKISMKLRTI